MPELPDITVYIEALEKRVLGQALEGLRIVSPFLLRTATPPLSEASGRKVFRLRRLGKRICIGLEVMEADASSFSAALLSANHTLKRALSDPRLFSGIGNAYSDEILFQAKLSPLALTQKLGVPEIHRLFEATRATLTHWIERLRAEAGNKFPENVTAFR